MLIDVVIEILSAFKEEIKRVEELNLDDFPNVELGIEVSRKYLRKLRFTLRDHEFASEKNEIEFFKKYKPCVHSKVIFYSKLYYFLLNKPMGTIKKQRKYIDEQIEILQVEMSKNLDFV